MLSFDSVFAELAALLLIAAATGILAMVLRQPLIVSFILVGVLAGPAWLNVIHSEEVIELLAEMGIAILLFVVGLKLDLHLVRGTGLPALTIGLFQMGATFAVGLPLGLAFGFSMTESLYLAIALCFSSTVIIIKLLSDKREIDALHGRLAVGVLIAQDIAVILILIGLSAFGTGGESSDLLQEIGLVAAKGFILLGGVGLFMRFGLPQLLPILARSRELLIIGAIGWAMALAAASEWLGFSQEVGAFLAGISLASTPFRDVIGARLMTLRDFLLLFFFLALGANLEFDAISNVLLPAVVLSLVVLTIKPLIVITIMGLLGYRRRTSFLTGVSLGQISEFSLILGTLGFELGHLDQDTLGLVTLIGITTIALSTYAIQYTHQLYDFLGPYLARFERKAPRSPLQQDPGKGTFDVILFGLGRYGSNIERHLEEAGLAVLGIDFDPVIVRDRQDLGRSALFGDAEDPDFPHTLPIEHSTIVVSTIPWIETSRTLLSSLKAAGYEGKVALTVHAERDAELLRASGADVILWPFADAAERATGILLETARVKH